MKQIILILTVVLSTFFLGANAQTSFSDALAEIPGFSPIILADTIQTTTITSEMDTTIVRMGKKDVVVIKQEKGTEYKWGKNKDSLKKAGKFDGHWEGIDIGFNSFAQTNYSSYNDVEFMSLNQGKSLEFDFNFYELNIGLVKSYVGLVSGIGLSLNNYRFDNPYTLAKGPMKINAVSLDNDNLSKTKLAVSYLRVPLLLEFQIPVNDNEGRLFVSGGVIGEVKIGSHTKVKHGNTKDKDHSGFYINSFNYQATASIGYKDIGLFGNYSLTPLFENGKGPELTPFTVGIRFDFE